MELWDGYDRDGQKLGLDLVRGRPLQKGVFHVVAHVVVEHKDGDFLLMQRDENKPGYPGLFEAGAGGAVLKGESFEQGAKRELLEETGLQGDVLQPLYRLVSEKNQRIYVGYYLLYRGAKDAVRLQEGETISYRWLSKADFLDFVETPAFVPALRTQMADFLAQLRAGEEQKND